jgi:hypothetical protein
MDNDFQTDLPHGVKLIRTLDGHQGRINSLALDPQGADLMPSWGSALPDTSVNAAVPSGL